MSPRGVQLRVLDSHVVMDNGILQVTLSNPEGIVTGVRYGNIDNLLEVINDESNRGYWDLVWSAPGSTGTTGIFDVIKGTSFNVIVENDEQVEISFTRTWDSSQEGKLVPLNIDKRFVLLRGCSGFYSYAIYEHLAEWPAFNLAETDDAVGGASISAVVTSTFLLSSSSPIVTLNLTPVPLLLIKNQTFYHWL
ncbi:uncharacterized protein LOC116125399 [Pistacia vera]|uniref:uncharacterized protein LOC116125399 n=1 Tax=Pistacia vera TaxID=55513 RepID=UPI001262C2EB|nr:uncharacterized protein LOC116125399 [Pistacia vera]